MIRQIKQTDIFTGEVTTLAWDYRNRLVGVVVKNGSGNDEDKSLNFL